MTVEEPRQPTMTELWTLLMDQRPRIEELEARVRGRRSIGARLPGHRGLTCMLAAALVLAVSGVARASIPDTHGVIHACFIKGAPLTRIIDSPTETCRSNETAISWNQMGPQGPAGPGGAPSVTRTVTLPKGYRCSLSNADTMIDDEFGNLTSRGCILDSTAVPPTSSPAAMGYVFRLGSGPWHSPAIPGSFRVRWVAGQLQMVELADACLCALSQNLTIRYQAVWYLGR